MKLYAPENYAAFRCTAGSCRHTCCRGWEIDVDKASLRSYRQVPGALGRKLRENLVTEKGDTHFRLLGEEERCPFLQEDGLCELICAMGESALCQVCTDHPRFRSFFTGRTEVGLGLCCEAAAALTLTDTRPMRLVLLEDDGGAEAPDAREQALLALRAGWIDGLQTRTLPLDARLDRLLNSAAVQLPQRTPSAWAAFYRTLEIMDTAWDIHLQGLEQAQLSAFSPITEALALPLEQFCVYLLYRHLPGAVEDDRVQARAAFAVLSTRLLAALCTLEAPETPEAPLLDLARMYSAEVEYDAENLDALFAALETESPFQEND